MEKTLLVPFTEAGRLLGIAKQTARNWEVARKFPVPTFLLGAKRMVRTEDLEKYVASLGAGISQTQNIQVPTPMRQSEVIKKRPRGRPRKQLLDNTGGASNE